MKWRRSCSEAMTRLRSCRDMRAPTQENNSLWSLGEGASSLCGPRGPPSPLKAPSREQQCGSHLEEHPNEG